MPTRSLHDHDVHLWWAGLSISDDERARLEATLSADERVRAARYRLGWLRRRFVVGRGILRVLLGEYLGIDPAAVQLQYGPFGKPALASAHASDVTFSLSHSKDVAVYAFSRGADVGVDIEHLRSRDGAAIVRRFFSVRERDIYCGLPDSQKPLAFLLGWTRKEAYVKGRGVGLSECLADVEVTLAPGESAQLLTAPDPGGAARWWLEEIGAAGGCVGAVAVGARPRRLSMTTLTQEDLARRCQWQ